ncbi:MAG: TIGR00266 family protein [Bdellovibrio sp.]
MQFEILKRPDFSWLQIQVPRGQRIFVEASAMASQSPNLRLQARLKGGFRRFLARESLFISEFTAEHGAGELCLAPGPFGDMAHVKLDSSAFYLASTCFLAHTEGVRFETKFQKLSQGLLSGMGWFLMRFSGSGDVWFNAYGEIIEMSVDGTEDLLIDNGHIVGFSEGVEYEIVKLGSYKSLFFSGEGFVCRFRGRGKIWIQTKKPQSLIAWAHQFRRLKSQN